MKEILWFETVQCMVRVYDTGEEVCGQRLFVISSYHKNNKHDNIRFGTKEQLKNLLGQYQFSVIGYKNNYENFMKSLGYKLYVNQFKLKQSEEY